jgi:hypothetical protein
MKEWTEPTPNLTAVGKVMERFSPRRRMSPAQLLSYWQQFVEMALGGYRASWYDFDNERRVRDVIQAVLDDAEVRRFPEADEWARVVEDVDRRYQEILVPIANQPNDQPWWLAGARGMLALS